MLEFLDLSDHQLGTISTWAEVGIFAFMVGEKLAPKVGFPVMNGISKSLAPTGFWRGVWDNRVLIVAIGGLAFIGWLNFGPLELFNRAYTSLAPSDFSFLLNKLDNQDKNAAEAAKESIIKTQAGSWVKYQVSGIANYPPPYDKDSGTYDVTAAVPGVSLGLRCQVPNLNGWLAVFSKNPSPMLEGKIEPGHRYGNSLSLSNCELSVPGPSK